jgi:hypothetical protein
MNEFKLWYTYYDSLFLNVNPRVSQLFYEEYSFIRVDIFFHKQYGRLMDVLTLLWCLDCWKVLLGNLQIGLIHSVNCKNWRVLSLKSMS